MEHFISLEQAIEMTTRFRENRDAILLEQFKGVDILPLAETFDRAAFDKILSSPDCQKLRIYLGMDAALKIHAIIVGVNAEDRDILPTDSARATITDAATATSTDETTDPEEDDEEDMIIEAGTRCPPMCIDSPLNP
ncbi:MAG TPA: hypothetical protein VGN63_19170 [Flavisolibacter sp.]|jgi:ferredoxin|nr:hypothetical protein [Flavisolibacter sp.]